MVSCWRTPETASEQLESVFHDATSRKWMCRPSVSVAEHARLLHPANLNFAFLHSYGIGDNEIKGLFVPHAFLPKSRRLLGLWINRGLDDLVRQLLGRVTHEPNQIGRYVSRFILHLDSGIGHCVEWFDTGHAIVSIHHYCATVGRFEADVIFTAPVEPSRLPDTPLASLYVKRDCPFCRLRQQPCECNRTMRRRVFPRPSFVGLDWGTFRVEMAQKNVSVDKFTVTRRNPLTAQPIHSTPMRSRSQYAFSQNASALLAQCWETLGCNPLVVSPAAVVDSWGWSSPSPALPAVPDPADTALYHPARKRPHPAHHHRLDDAPLELSLSTVEVGDLDAREQDLGSDVSTDARAAAAQSPALVPDLVPKVKTKPKPKMKFKCTLCPRRFQQQAHMDQHILTVHEKMRPFTCELCSQKFGSKSNLNRHVRSVHEGIKVNRKPRKPRQPDVTEEISDLSIAT